MPKEGTVLAFSGAIGSGSSSISEALAKRLNWPRISFGDYIRRIASKHGRDESDRAVLQQIGQALVVTDVDGFVKDVLACEPWRAEGNLVLDGLRHVEVRHALIQHVDPSRLRVVHVKLDEDARQSRAAEEHHIEPRMLARYDEDLTEAQIPRIIPAYADFTVDGALPTSIIVEQIIAKFDLDDGEAAAAG